VPHARARLPRRAALGRGRGRGRGVAWRGVSRRDETIRDRDRDREAYALFVSHVDHNILY
jgi:hypothetical protein